MGHTEIQVTAGIVSKRRMHKWEHDGLLEPGWIEWEETGMQIGTHADGAPAKTLDQLYASCLCEDIALQEVGGSLYRQMRIDENGLLLSCCLFDLDGPDNNPNLVQDETYNPTVADAYSKLNVSNITLGGTLLPMRQCKAHQVVIWRQ